MSIKSKKTTKSGKIQEKVPAYKNAKTRKKPAEAQVSDPAGRKIKVVMTKSKAIRRERSRSQGKRPEPEMKAEMKAEKGLNAVRWCELGCGYD